MNLYKLKRDINYKKYGELYSCIDKSKFKEFKSREEVEKWGDKIYGGWANCYKQIMKESKKYVNLHIAGAPIENYCGNVYREINRYLRTDEDDAVHSYRELSDILCIALRSAPRIPCDLVLYRLVNEEFVNNLFTNHKKKNVIPIYEKGFMSTSFLKSIVNVGESYADQKYLLKIYAHKNTTGIYVNSIVYRDEYEMLLIPGLYLGMVEYPYTDKKSGKVIIECELIEWDR